MKLPAWLVVVLLALVILAASGAAVVTVSWLGPVGGGREAGSRDDLNDAVLGPVYDAGTFTVNLASQRVRFMRAAISLEVDHASTISALDSRRPAVRDAIINVLRQASVEELAEDKGLQALRTEIAAAVSSLLTEGRIRRVFFTELIIQ